MATDPGKEYWHGAEARELLPRSGAPVVACATVDDTARYRDLVHGVAVDAEQERCWYIEREPDPPPHSPARPCR